MLDISLYNLDINVFFIKYFLDVILIIFKN